MTKYLHTPEMVAHLWANQSQDSARSKNMSAYFNGPELFSYGEHYLTGYIIHHPKNGRRIALLNTTKYSVTTSRRQRDAASAALHMDRLFLPDLTSIRDLLRNCIRGQISKKTGEHWNWASDRKDYEVATNEKVAYWYLHRHAGVLEHIERHIFGELFGLSPETVDKAERNGLAAQAKAKAAKAKLANDFLMREVKAWGAMSDAVWRENWPKDLYSPTDGAIGLLNNWAEQQRRIARTAKSTKLSARRVQLLAARAKEATAWAKDAIPRATRVYFARLQKEFEDWQAGTAPRPNAWQYEGEQAAAIRADELREARESRAKAFADWQAGSASRPRLNDYDPLSAEHAAIRADIDREATEAVKAFDLWRAAQGPRPATALFRYTEASNRRPDAFHMLRNAEERELDQERREREKATFEAWLGGASVSLPSFYQRDAFGRAYVRRRGDELETSQGAYVPWDHAVKAFKFIKLCRERGQGFKANGRSIRVGYFTVSEITPNGDMTAGCHQFSWDEISRLAQREGVFDVQADDSAVILREVA